MNIPQQRPRDNQKKSGVESGFSRGWHDLGTPLGASILGIIVVCGFLSIIIDYIGERYNIPQSIINPIIFIIIAIAIIMLVYKVSSATKKATKKRKELYQQKFGGNRKDGGSK
jgi:hypothetical protein